MRLSGLVSYDGQVGSNAMVGVYGDLVNVWVQSDSRGRYSGVVPKGDVSLYATATVNGQEVVFLERLNAIDSASIDLVLQDGLVLSGTVEYAGGALAGADVDLQDLTARHAGGGHQLAGKYRAEQPAASISHTSTTAPGPTGRREPRLVLVHLLQLVPSREITERSGTKLTGTTRPPRRGPERCRGHRKDQAAAR
jgi:hypothetical protein